LGFEESFAATFVAGFSVSFFTFSGLIAIAGPD
jgi:hypothetical protein